MSHNRTTRLSAILPLSLFVVLALPLGLLASPPNSIGAGSERDAKVADPCTPRTADDFDINADGVSLSVADYVALVMYIMGDSSSIGNPYAADFNGDCVINYADARRLDSLFKYGTVIFCGEFGPCLFPCACTTVPVRKCCYGFRGNVNSDAFNTVDLADLSTLASYLRGGTVRLKCPEAANIDGTGIVNLGDLSLLVTYLTGGAAPPPACP